jgi:Uma2 family endonuclease
VITSTNKAISLEEFLSLPETKPVQEYINGEIISKPMPKGKHKVTTIFSWLKMV